MREVSTRATRMLLEAAADVGIDVDALVVGVPVSAAGLRDPASRIDWEHFAGLLARLDALCGESVRPEEIGERMLKMPSFDFLPHVGQLLVSPRQLYEVARRLVPPALFSNVIVRHDWRPSGRLVVTGELLPGYREST